MLLSAAGIAEILLETCAGLLAGLELRGIRRFSQVVFVEAIYSA